MTTYPQHIVDHATKMIALGTKMKFEAICEMQLKVEARNKKKLDPSNKKEIAKAESRKRVEEMEPIANASEWLAEKNRENAKKNLPSSLR